jgi:DNA-binding NarL/FixJ family response regulator
MTVEGMAQVLHLSESTLKRRLQEIYAKLGVTTLRGATVKVVRLGLA